MPDTETESGQPSNKDYITVVAQIRSGSLKDTRDGGLSVTFDMDYGQLNEWVRLFACKDTNVRLVVTGTE